VSYALVVNEVNRSEIELRRAHLTSDRKYVGLITSERKTLLTINVVVAVTVLKF